MAWTKDRFEHEMKKFDGKLRIREGVDRTYIIERKCARESKCLIPPRERQHIDAFIGNRDGYVRVMTVPKERLNHDVFLTLRANDLWEHRGAGPFADALEAQEAAEEARKEQAASTQLEACTSEAYDQLAWQEGRRVGMAL